MAEFFDVLPTFGTGEDRTDGEEHDVEKIVGSVKEPGSVLVFIPSHQLHQRATKRLAVDGTLDPRDSRNGDTG